MVPVSTRRIVAVLVVVLGLLQALDSGSRAAPDGIVVAIVGTVVAVGMVFWWSANSLTQFVAGLVCIGVMSIARALSPVPLPTLALAGWFPCVAALLLLQVTRGRERGEPGR